MKKAILSAVSGLAVLLAGCSAYKWGTTVPQAYRSVSVPVFENFTDFPELGPAVAQYTLREFQREGTFRIARPSDAAIEVQGALAKMTRYDLTYDRGNSVRATEYRCSVEVEVTIVDKKTGKVLLERKPVTGETTFAVQNDLQTSQRNATARIADDIARQIVNEALALDYGARGGNGAVEGVQK